MIFVHAEAAKNIRNAAEHNLRSDFVVELEQYNLELKDLEKVINELRDSL